MSKIKNEIINNDIGITKTDEKLSKNPLVEMLAKSEPLLRAFNYNKKDFFFDKNQIKFKDKR